MKVNIYHVLCNIKVRTIFKQNEAIYRKKDKRNWVNEPISLTSKCFMSA